MRETVARARFHMPTLNYIVIHRHQVSHKIVKQKTDGLRPLLDDEVDKMCARL